MEKVSVLTLVVHFNSPDECIQLIEDYKDMDMVIHNLLIVDNCSSLENYNKLSEFISKLSKKNIILKSNQLNGGFGYGVNEGFKFAVSENINFEFLHVVNCDTKIVNKNYLSALSELLKKNNDIGIAGPAVFKENQNEIQNTILPFTRLKNALGFSKTYNNLSYLDDNSKPIDCEVVNGVCFMIPKIIFEKTGGFDEDYFMYNEEHDLCLKVKKLGKRIVFYPIKSIAHKGMHLSVEEKMDWRFVFNRRNQVLFIAKNYNVIEAMILAKLFSISVLIKILKGKKICISPLYFWWTLLKATFATVNNEKLLYNCRLKNLNKLNYE